jgi:3',5'-cyclic-AMP phosphodiesterase
VDVAVGALHADEAAAGIELTTVSTTSATFHRGTEVAVVDGLEPATPYEHHGIAYTTLRRPPGELRCRVATINDVHFGETEAGRVGASDRGPILSVPTGAPPYPYVMNHAAVAEMVAADDVQPFAAVIAKGDLTAEGADDEFAAFEACYRTPFGDRLFAVRGNHDCLDGQTAYAADQWIEVDGLNIALLDTAVPGHSHGAVSDEQVAWMDSLAGESTDPVVVMGHHPQRLGDDAEDPSFFLTAESSAALDEVFARRRAIVAYTAGHTHRHRVRSAGGGVPSVEVGCVKDFPGTWAEYEVYDGGILQIVHRVSTAEALAWSERCRGLYADFGLDYVAYALGRLDDRCFEIRHR